MIKRSAARQGFKDLRADSAERRGWFAHKHLRRSDGNGVSRTPSPLELARTRSPRHSSTMRHLRQAHLVGKDERGLTLDCGEGTTCRIIAVTNEIVRVLFLQGGAPREPRSWMVLGQPDGPGVIDCKTRSTPPQAPLKCARHLHARPTYFLCSCRLLTGESEAAAHVCKPSRQASSQGPNRGHRGRAGHCGPGHWRRAG